MQHPPKKGFIGLYLGIAAIVVFLLIAALAPKIGNKLGFLSQSKEFQSGYALIDSDNDGFDNETEVAIGTLPNVVCSQNGQDAWPPDFNKDGKVDSQDDTLFKQQYGRFRKYNKRYDLTANGSVNKKDRKVFLSFLGKNCSQITPPSINPPALSASPTPTPTPAALVPPPTNLPSASPSTSPIPQPGLPEYGVRPVIFLPADTNIDINSYTAQVNQSFQMVKEWYAGQLGGKTFDRIDAITYKSPLTADQLYSKYSGNMAGIWFQGMREAIETNGLTVCDPKRFYYFVTPLENVWGGMVGAENLGCTSHVLPGTASIPNHTGRLLGGVIDPNWNEWWADEIREAQGGVAHELGHGFGGECINNVCNGLAHSEDPSIMFAWWDFDKSGVFFDIEKEKILKSPFIR